MCKITWMQCFLAEPDLSWGNHSFDVASGPTDIDGEPLGEAHGLIGNN